MIPVGLLLAAILIASTVLCVASWWSITHPGDHVSEDWRVRWR